MACLHALFLDACTLTCRMVALAGSLPIECPTANYCPGVGNVFPSLCTPGFYNDRMGRNKCIECPIGHICDQVCACGGNYLLARWRRL